MEVFNCLPRRDGRGAIMLFKDRQREERRDPLPREKKTGEGGNEIEWAGVRRRLFLS